MPYNMHIIKNSLYLIMLRRGMGSILYSYSSSILIKKTSSVLKREEIYPVRIIHEIYLLGTFLQAQKLEEEEEEPSMQMIKNELYLISLRIHMGSIIYSYTSSLLQKILGTTHHPGKKPTS
jgi:DUF2075 family protein